jgi:CRISPR-associated protein Cas2
MKIWLICYDMADDKRRYHVDKLLSGYGERIQYSAFECRLSTSQFTRLRKQLRVIITYDDKINYYSVCTWCAGKRLIQGRAMLPAKVDFYVV